MKGNMNKQKKPAGAGLMKGSNTLHKEARPGCRRPGRALMFDRHSAQM